VSERVRFAQEAPSSDGTKDLFLHHSGIAGYGVKSLAEGARVSSAWGNLSWMRDRMGLVTRPRERSPD
jgi:cold shock CspA family protein